MINIKIENETALDMLIERLKVWTDNREAIALYEKMYESYIDGGCFDGCEFDPMVIVDNDWVNYCKIISAGDEDFDSVLKEYKENDGCGDISCGNTGYSFIESVDDEDDPTAFLVRC